MSTPQATSQLPATVQAKTEVEFVPFGSEDRIKLNLAVIRNYIATPTREGDLPDDRSCMRFLMLCRSRRLDPFTGDAFLIGFRKRDAEQAEWNLITSQSAFMKRAEVHPEFDGLASGIIVKDSEDRIIEREGDFEHEGDTLLGGWAIVHFKNRKHPMTKKVSAKTYRKPFGVWVTDPAGMICKVAEVHALRDAFPTMLGGMMLREEYIDVESTVTATREVRRPEFAEGLPAAQLPDAPATNSRKNEKTTQKTTQERPAGVNTPPAASNAAAEAPANAIPPSGGSPGPSDEEAEAAAGLAPSRNETQTSAAAADPPGAPTTPAPAAAAPPAPSAPKNDPGTFKPRDGEGIPLTSVRRWLHTEDKSEAELLTVLVANKAAKAGQKLNELSEAKLDNVYKARATLLTQMNQQPAK